MASKSTKGHAEAANDLLAERGLPQSVDTERLCLGAVLLDSSKWEILSGLLAPEDFALEKHRRIFKSMAEVVSRGEMLDRVTCVNELMRVGWLESVDGMSYVVSLDDGLPEIVNFDAYVKIVKEKSDLRKAIYIGQRMIDQAVGEVGRAQEIVAAATLSLSPIQVGPEEDAEGGRTVTQIVESFPAPPGVPSSSAFLDPTLRKRGLATGFRKLDEMLGGGLQNGELIIIAARPRVGKSALLSNICQYVSTHRHNPHRTDFFSLEMSGESLITRMLCGSSRVDQHKFRAGYLNKDERESLQKSLHELTESPIRIHDEFRKTLPGLVRRIRRAVKDGSRLIGIDYAQLMVTGAKAENRNLEISEICRTLKLLTLELLVPIVLLSQIGRAAEKRGGGMRPQLSDLKDSGTLEESADVVMAIHRAEIYKKDDATLQGIAELEILKQRNGPCGIVPLRFLGHFVKFENRAEDSAFPEEVEKENQDPPPMAPTPPDPDVW